jgi:hypothetical protein
VGLECWNPAGGLHWVVLIHALTLYPRVTISRVSVIRSACASLEVWRSTLSVQVPVTGLRWEAFWTTIPLISPGSKFSIISIVVEELLPITIQPLPYNTKEGCRALNARTEGYDKC